MKNSFMEKAGWLWLNAEQLLIILFLATFTLNIRKIFLTPYSFLNGEFNEYMTLSFSWADLLMFAVIIIYTTKWILRQFDNPNTKKSLLGIVIRFVSIFSHRITELLRSHVIVSRETIMLLVLLVWIGLTILWSQYKPMAFYKFATFLEISLFSVITVKSLNNQKWLKMAFFALIFNGFFQSILGIAQFVHNGSLGFRWLGESNLNPNIDGVAKIIILSEKHIRAYGTFLHPNILAGFLIIPLFVLGVQIVYAQFPFLSKEEDRGWPNMSYQKNDPTLLSLNEKKDNEVSRGTFLGIIPTLVTLIIFTIILVGFLLTFSRSAYLGLIAGLISLAFIHRYKFMKIIRLTTLGLFIAFIIFFAFFIYSHNNDISIFSTQSLQERIMYQNVARETISAFPLQGVGIGQFVYSEHKMYPNLSYWQYQPVHNIFLLIFSELGIIGLIFFLLWIISILEKESSENGNTDLLLTDCLFCCILFSYFFIFLFDHYFWDIKIGMITFALPIILSHLWIKFERNH